MRVCIDIEANALVNPTKIWLIVCKDIDTGKYYKFRNVTEKADEAKAFAEMASKVNLWIGHNWLGYDWPVLESLLGMVDASIATHCVDTLIISKLVDYSRVGHSIEAYGIEFGIPKGQNYGPGFFNKWSQELEDYCVRDVDICHKIYLKYLAIINDPAWLPSITLEHEFQLIVNQLQDNGFSFNTSRATRLLEKVKGELDGLDKEIERAFPPRLRCLRTIFPKVTQHGTLHKGDFRWVKDGDLSEFNGGPFSRCTWESFNASSHKQVVDTLNLAGWHPTDKTQTYIDTERELNRLKYSRDPNKGVALSSLHGKLETLKNTGWKINEQNLNSLPPNAPAPARTLARRILLESRRRTLTEWLGLVSPDTQRVHGSFYGIGAWTHRMAHQRPNTANIPNDLDTQGKTKLYGKEMRSLWQAPKGRLLVGVDAEGIQLRIFAHYIDDPEFTDALVKGKKDDKTDPHSLNQRILGDVCRSRASAKRFIYALLLGAGMWKLAQILECSEAECKEALNRLLLRYEGWAMLRETVIPRDGQRGFFAGLDGRKVRIPGSSVGERKHLCMSGYLQNGESVIMKKATCRWHPKLKLKYPDIKLVNFVHDEYIVEVANNVVEAEDIQDTIADSLREVGDELKLKCPLAGSIYNSYGERAIGRTWLETH